MGRINETLKSSIRVKPAHCLQSTRHNASPNPWKQEQEYFYKGHMQRRPLPRSLARTRQRECGLRSQVQQGPDQDIAGGAIQSCQVRLLPCLKDRRLPALASPKRDSE